VLAVADRGYVMRRGRIVLEGSADEMRSRWRDVSEAYVAPVPPARR
jgi:ABC-type branched-subunit amino acid transport system ATPase component